MDVTRTPRGANSGTHHSGVKITPPSRGGSLAFPAAEPADRLPAGAARGHEGDPPGRLMNEI